jgi:indole-3-glycerol phosphate synthase
MQAIAHNQLSELEESIASQQVLSARLSELANELCVPLEAKPASPSRTFIDKNLSNRSAPRREPYRPSITATRSCCSTPAGRSR